MAGRTPEAYNASLTRGAGCPNSVALNVSLTLWSLTCTKPFTIL
jgi:hypothetical protein